MHTKSKYFELAIAIFLSIAGFFLLLAIIFYILKYFIAGVNLIPGIQKAFAFCILSLPAFVLLPVYAIFGRRTKNHPSVAVRGISYLLVGLALLAIIVVYIFDLSTFFRTGNADIMDYYCFDHYFIVPGITLLFVLATLQALTSAKETDWMDRQHGKIP